jgi:hypothetical protein
LLGTRFVREWFPSLRHFKAIWFRIPRLCPQIFDLQGQPHDICDVDDFGRDKNKSELSNDADACCQNALCIVDENQTERFSLPQ